MTDDWLNERLANRRKPGDPDYDAFYDATDDELAGMVRDAQLPVVRTTLPEMRAAAEAGETMGEFYDRLAGGDR